MAVAGGGGGLGFSLNLSHHRRPSSIIISPSSSLSSSSSSSSSRRLRKPFAVKMTATLDEKTKSYSLRKSEEAFNKAKDIWNKTWYPKAVDHLMTEKPWYVVDANDKILGRLASTIAVTIRGKNLGTYTPSQDMGAFVIVVNAEKVAVSGKKRTQKLYRRHSGRPGGMKVETFNQLQQRIPERIIEHAVRGMLPKGPLGRRLFHHLKVYKGPNHPHEAQQPKDLPLRDKRIQMEK
ncbi:hypothetical protein Droror1_Dr00019068 [Drosera rotundifolia]